MSENQLNAIKNNYNHVNYDYEVKRLSEESPVEYAMTLRLLDRWVASGTEVLDVGVGVGHYALHLAQRGCRIHLIDIAENLLTAAKQRLSDADLDSAVIGSSVASATDLSAMSDNVFDVVLLLGPLYHLCSLAERQQAVSEARRVLKSGGILLAAGINRFAYLRAVWERIPHEAKDRADFHRRYVNEGVVTPELAPPLGYAHLTTVSEFRELFSPYFEEQLVAGIESFTGHAQKQFLELEQDNREAWLDVVEATSTTSEAYGATEHFLYIGRKTEQ